MPLFPDTSIKMLLKAYLALKKFQHHIKIVPIFIEYDRIFDSKYLSTDTQTGIFKPGTPLVSVIRRIFSKRKKNLGKCIIKHGDAIDLNEYVAKFYSS